LETKIILFAYNIMKGGNSDSKTPEVLGFDYDNVSQYGSVDLKGGKGKKVKKSSGPRKSSSKFDGFDFEKEWKEFETSYNQKYGGKAKAKKAKKATSAKKTRHKQRGGNEMTDYSSDNSTEEQDLTQTGGKSKAKAKAKKAAPKRKAPKRKSQRGGDERGATFAPAPMFDEKATMNSPPAGPFQSAYGTINAVDGLQRNLAPYPNPSGQQTGGAKKKKASKVKKTKTATKPTKPKKDSKKKDTKKTKATGKKVSVLDKIKKFFAM